MTVDKEKNENTISTKENGFIDEPADFEEAISATGYGLFNVLLLLATIPAAWTTVFDTTTAAFILPLAECDFELTLFRKGTFTAITFAGMILTTFLWGFMADHLGRKYVIIFTVSLDAICNILSSTVQSYYTFLAIKFLTGCIISGSQGIVMTYMAEFHGQNYRSRVMMWYGSLYTLGDVVIPVLAWAILPQDWSFTIFGNYINYTSWRIFLFVCSFPPALGVVTSSLFPESPKFLMTKGKHEEAMRIFRKMYSMNTGKPEDTFPIKKLLCEQKEPSANASDAKNFSKIQDTWSDAKLLFAKPYVYSVLVVTSLQFGTLLGNNTLRLWMPQLFTLLTNFNVDDWDYSRGMPTVCERLNFDVVAVSAVGNQTINEELADICTPTHVDSSVYVNGIIIPTVSIIGFLLSGIIITKSRRKVMISVIFLIAAISFMGLNWSPTILCVLVLASIAITMTRLSMNMIISVTIDVIPTSLRSMSVSLVVMTGRIGSLAGNLIFPILLDVNCPAAFILLGGFMSACFLLSFFLPKTSGKLQ